MPTGLLYAAGSRRQTSNRLPLVRAEKVQSATDGQTFENGSNPDNTLNSACPCVAAAYPAVEHANDRYGLPGISAREPEFTCPGRLMATVAIRQRTSRSLVLALP